MQRKQQQRHKQESTVTKGKSKSIANIIKMDEEKGKRLKQKEHISKYYYRLEN